MGVSAPGAHFGSDPDGFHDLLGRGSFSGCGLGVTLDAVRALGDMGHGDRDQLFGLARKRPVVKDSLAERPKRRLGIRRESAPLVGALFLFRHCQLR